MIPTTDEMDHITHSERIALVGMCSKDGEWVQFTRGKELNQIVIHPGCGGSLLSQTIHTQRTFNAERAKKETAKYLKKVKK